MAKRRVARTRNGGKWTEARFWGFIRSALRKASVRWPVIHEAKRASRRPIGKPKEGRKKTRQKWEYQCAICERWFPDKETHVDHIVPVGTLKCFEDLPGFVERLFCEQSGLRVACKTCHQDVTNEQRVSA